MSNSIRESTRNLSQSKINNEQGAEVAVPLPAVFTHRKTSKKEAPCTPLNVK